MASWLTKALTRMRHNPQSVFMGRFLKRTRYDYRKEVGDCIDASVVTAPVQWIQRALPEARLTVMQYGRGGKVNDLADHAMLQLINRPNAYYGDLALWAATVWSWCVAGNAYWIKVRNGVGVPVELWYAPHWMLEPKGSDDGREFLTHYRYSPGGVEPMRLEPEDVVHFRHGLDPRDPRKGLSPIDGAVREIFMDLESSNFVASLLRNMGVPGVVISPKTGGVVAQEDVAATKAWFQEAFGGDRRGGPLVMGAPTDVVPYGFNPQQMNMSEARDVAEERICACLGIPAAVVGFGAGLQATKVGATMSEMIKLAWRNGVLPPARMMADELDRSLLPDFPAAGSGRLKTEWDTSEVLALSEDEDKETTRWQARLTSGAVTVAEAREAWGMEVDDSHRIYLRPISSIEVPVGAPPRDPEPEPKQQGEKAARAPVAAQRAGMAFLRAIQRQEDPLARAFEKRLKGFFVGFGKAAEKAALPLLEAENVAPKDAVIQETKADDLVVEMILEALGIGEHQTTFRRLFEAQYLEVGKKLAEAAELAGLGGSLPDPVARSIVGAGGRRAGLVDLNEQTKRTLFDALAEGRAEGEGAAQLAARVAQHVEGGPWLSAETRARTIARTETKYAQNISTIERARAANVERFIVFDGRLGPGRSLPDHIARNGEIVTADAAAQMAADEHPNGTLSFAPYFGDDDE
ncbi:phage portal protein [Phyllobacterium leguminum]|uniref:HK97 family phage portal protein n=1 Tax=Phyllobacterium leguminum TaxID=314237 RepID=A0A318SY93_9HYPH|nr:phage portal protein [Phyllobacterium leguminum]PYE86901.1 HK97 family phage portal protein [Phyllobacterium leguminum]